MRMPSMLCGCAMQTRQGAAGIRKARQHRVSDARAALVDKKAAPPIAKRCRCRCLPSKQRIRAASMLPVIPSSRPEGSVVTTFTVSEELEQLLVAASIDLLPRAARLEKNSAIGAEAVSYTHLTLPTILRV